MKTKLEFRLLDASRLEEAYSLLGKVGRWIESQGRRQRITKTTFDEYAAWQREKANFVVLAGDEIVGLVTRRPESLTGWTELDIQGDPVWMIRALAANPEYRGTGIGQFAMNRVIELHQQESAEPLFLDCVSQFLPEYYGQFGFEIVTRQDRVFESEIYDVTLMRLTD